jgi:protein SCO1/2
MIEKMLLIGVGLSLGMSRGASQPAQPSARVFEEVGIDQKLNQQIPLDLEFRDEKGRPVPLRDYFGKRPVVLSLVYYNCPMLCTEILNGMVETFRTIDFTVGREFDVVTISIDPSETPELAASKKQHYLEMYGREQGEAGWHFLTGDRASIQSLANAVGFHYVYDETSKLFAHASGIMIATPSGRLARYLYGIEYGAKDLTFSLMEAAENRIGSPVDKLLLLCYHYDPLTGKYGVLVTNIVRGGGLLCVFLLGGYMLVNFRRDRLRRKERTV